jgi:mRNA interferase MazF
MKDTPELETLLSVTAISLTEEVVVEYAPRRIPPRIKAAPSIREIYWCDFPLDPILPEMGKTRPALVVSFKNTLTGHCLVLPISTDPQDGMSAAWAHRLSLELEPGRVSYVVCNHLYTVATARLQPLVGKRVPRLGIKEFDEILVRMHGWLPRPTTKA